MSIEIESCRRRSATRRLLSVEACAVESRAEVHIMAPLEPLA